MAYIFGNTFTHDSKFVKIDLAPSLRTNNYVVQHYFLDSRSTYRLVRTCDKTLDRDRATDRRASVYGARPHADRLPSP